IEGKGRGIVATKNIQAGQLLIACKAFVYSDETDTADPTADPSSSEIGSDAQEDTEDPMIEMIHNKLARRPEMVQEFYQLYAGPRLGHIEKYDRKSDHVEDMERIEGILRYNSFKAGDIFSAFKPPESIKQSGLWIVPSYFNHSCVDFNCFRYFVGDFMFVRA